MFRLIYYHLFHFSLSLKVLKDQDFYISSSPLGVQKHHSTCQAYIIYTINNSIKRQYSADKDVKIDIKMYLCLCNEDRNTCINRLCNKFIHLTSTHFMFHRKDCLHHSRQVENDVCSDNNKKHIEYTVNKYHCHFQC